MCTAQLANAGRILSIESCFDELIILVLIIGEHNVCQCIVSLVTGIAACASENVTIPHEGTIHAPRVFTKSAIYCQDTVEVDITKYVKVVLHICHVEKFSPVSTFLIFVSSEASFLYARELWALQMGDQSAANFW